MRAVGRYILIRKDKDQSRNVGGLDLSETMDKDVRYVTGEVLSIGDLVNGLKEGDKIYYDKVAGHGIDVDGDLLHVIRDTDIVIIL